MISPFATSVLSATAAHLDSACTHAHHNAGEDLLSPWANTAMSIHLAAGGLQLHLPGPVVPAEHPDCLTALRAGADELARLPIEDALPLLDAVLVHTQLTAALRHAQALQA